MSEISRVLYDIAKQDEGTWEWAGDDHNPKVLSYYSDAGHPEIRRDEVPWCAAFVGAVLSKAGLKNTGSLLARSYENWGEAVPRDQAEKGDIVVMKRGSSTWQGHIGFFDGWENGGARVRILGGNQGNQVNITAYDASRITAIRRPKPQRTSIVKSKTVAASGATVAAGAGGVVTAVGGLSDRAQEIMIVLSVVVILAGLFIFRERIKHWAEGVK